MNERRLLLDRLERREFDLLIIGGGIVGAGIARDAAMRGLSVALIEQGDFASGTSSKTSKLIHGGLRYLEHGRIRLVAESVREREVLRTIAPEVVNPLALLLPLYRDNSRPVWKIRAGLWLYDRFASGHAAIPSSLLTAEQALAQEPRLSKEGLLAAGRYGDCQMNDARLCLLNVLQASGFGAVCVNYARARALLFAQGQVCGAAVEDALDGQAYEVRAAVVVNATGPWSDAVRRLSTEDAPARLTPTKGIHLIVPRLSRNGLFIEAKRDQRMIFVLPWGADASLIGTTESPVDGPLDALRPQPDEISYLLEEIRRAMPGEGLSEHDLIASFAGARPLLTYAGSTSKASREHAIEVDRNGLISILGGKYTTYRRMSQEVTDHVMRSLGRPGERCITDRVSLQEEVPELALGPWRSVIDRLGPETVARLIRRYGMDALSVFRLIQQDPALAQPACSHHPYLAAELVHAIRSELACTITDVLARRTGVAWSACHGLEILPSLVKWFEQHAGYSHTRMAKQVDAYVGFLSRAKAGHPVLGASSVIGQAMHESII